MESFYKKPDRSSPYYEQYRNTLASLGGEKEAGSLGRWARRLSLAALLTVSAPGETPRREEAPLHPGASFSEGIAFLQERARTADIEEAAAYVAAGDKGQWVFAKKGEARWVRVPLSKVSESAAAFLGTLDDKNELSGSARLCLFHTHPLKAVRYVDASASEWHGTEEVPPAPPSLTDIGGLSGDMSFRGMPVYMVEGVVDARGVYYYRLFPEDQFAADYPKQYASFRRSRELMDEVAGHVAALLEPMSAEALREHLRRDAKEKLSQWGAQPSVERLRRLAVTVVLNAPESTLRAWVVRQNPALSPLFSRWDPVRNDRVAHFEDAYAAWVRVSRTQEESLTQTDEYRALQEAYRLLGADIRYTEKVQEEIPCAGPDSLVLFGAQ